MNDQRSMRDNNAADLQRPLTGPEWPIHGLEYLGKCPICGSTERVALHDGLADRWFGAPGSWTLHRCKDCESGYLDPRPSESTIHLAYENYFTHVDTFRKSLIPPADTFVGALKRKVMQAYLNSRIADTASVIERLSVCVLWLRPGLQRNVESVLRHQAPSHRGSTLLDIGCGSGEFLRYAKEAGWDASGTEFDEKAAVVARQAGFTVYTETMENLIERGLRFDAITMSHVIEHVHRPLHFLRTARGLLKANGSIWIETPNMSARGHTYYGRQWSGLHPPHHLVVLSKSGLIQLLSAAGFANVKTAPWRPLWRTITADSVTNVHVLREGQTQLRGLTVAWHDLWSLFQPNRREFITLTASSAHRDVEDRIYTPSK